MRTGSAIPGQFDTHQSCRTVRNEQCTKGAGKGVDRLQRWIRDGLSGGGFALAGVALVELLLGLGLRPLTPLGWPGLGMVAGAAFGGMPGFFGGGALVLAYYAANLLQPERFPQFYSNPGNAIAWACGLGLLGAAAALLRHRVFRLQDQVVHAAATEVDLETSRRYEAEARANEARLRLLTDTVPALVAYVDTEERYTFANRLYEEWLGIPGRSLVGRSVREAWGDERYAFIKPNIERALRGERVSYEYTLAHRGLDRRLRATYVPELDADGNVRGFIVLAVEVTELSVAQSELRAARGRLEAALEGSSVALWDTDLRTGQVYLSEAWADIVGGAPGETRATLPELFALLHPDDLEAVRRVSVQALKDGSTTYSVDHRVRCANGQWKWLLSRGRVTERDPVSGRALRMIGTNIEITDRKRVEEELQSIALTDSLTGLANRPSLMDRLRFAAARSARSGKAFAVLYLDLDRFKEVNDTLGHAAGDNLLAEFANRLRACVRQADTVARLGGDEFVVVLEDIDDCASAERVAKKVLVDAVCRVRVAGRDRPVTTSIGVACGRIGEAPELLLRRADAALYEAKKAGRDRCRLAA